MTPAHDTEKQREHLRVWLKILKASHAIEGEIRRKLRENHNTTLPRFDVMSALARFENGLKMSDLSSYLKVSNGNVTGIVTKLTEDGLAERITAPGDRRSQIARLTPQGRAEFAELAKHHRGWISEMLSGLSPQDIQNLSNSLDVVLSEHEVKGTVHAH